MQRLTFVRLSRPTDTREGDFVTAHFNANVPDGLGLSPVPVTFSVPRAMVKSAGLKTGKRLNDRTNQHAIADLIIVAHGIAEYVDPVLDPQAFAG